MNRYYASAIVGVVLGLFMGYLAWQHNPQQEIVFEGSIDYLYLSFLFLSLVIIGFIVSLIIVFLIDKTKFNNRDL